MPIWHAQPESLQEAWTPSILNLITSDMRTQLQRAALALHLRTPKRAVALM